MAKYLKQRGNAWYVQIAVPKDLQGPLKRQVIIKSLKTRDLQEAKERRWNVVADIKAQFQHARHPEVETPADLIRAATLDQGADSSQFDDALRALLIDKFGLDDKDGLPVIPPDWRESVSTAIRIQNGTAGKLIEEALQQHLEEITPRVRNQTLKARKRRIGGLVEWGGNIELSAFTRTMAGDYVNKVLIQPGRSPKTTRDILSDISAFWNWCFDRGFTGDNPWRGQSRTILDTKRGTRDKTNKKRRGWTRAELTTLLTTIRDEHGKDDPLWHMVLIGLYTGMRGNEIAELELTDIHKDHFHIPQGKTESSIRDVPIHPKIRRLVAKLKKESGDGYLISGLVPGGEDDKRGHGILKRFSYFKRTHVTDDRALVFHSLRNTVATALENGGVSEIVAQQIVGHQKKSMTFSLYSDGVDLPVLKRAMNKIDYGKGVSALVGGK